MQTLTDFYKSNKTKKNPMSLKKKIKNLLQSETGVHRNWMRF